MVFEEGPAIWEEEMYHWLCDDLKSLGAIWSSHFRLPAGVGAGLPTARLVVFPARTSTPPRRDRTMRFPTTTEHRIPIHPNPSIFETVKVEYENEDGLFVYTVEDWEAQTKVVFGDIETLKERAYNALLDEGWVPTSVGCLAKGKTSVPKLGTARIKDQVSKIRTGSVRGPDLTKFASVEGEQDR